jgi:four helix bundle protein
VAVQTYRDLIVWQRAMDLVLDTYQLTWRFPQEEIYGLTSQVRRSAVSVPSNIAEGQGRGVGAEFAHHLRISQGSLQELETQLLLAERLRYIRTEDVEPVLATAAEVGRLNRGLQKALP